MSNDAGQPTDEAAEPDMAHWDTHVGIESLDLETVKDLPFEVAYEALDEAVRRLETGDLSLENSIAIYERGIALSARCGSLLEAAELRVQQVDADGQVTGEVAL